MFFIPPPVILVQPAPRTQYLGESATFSVVLKAPGAATFQWRRNGVVIPKATSFLYVTPPLTTADDNEKIDVVVTDGGESLVSHSASVRVGPVVTSYTAANGAALQLYAWPGRNVTFLTQSNELSPPVMRNLLATTDTLWDYYSSATGHPPDPSQAGNGHAVFAQTDKGCGAACSTSGTAHVELTYDEMRSIYTAQSQSKSDEALFIAFSRIFGFYNDRLAYKSPDSSLCITSGISALLRERALLDLATHGSSVDPSGNTIMGVSKVRSLIVSYAETSALNWSNTFRTNTFIQVPGATCGDLVVSLLNSFIASFGGEPFLQNFLREAGKRSPAKSTQDAVDNFVLAASAAAHRDLAPQFETQWRWPVSNAAKNESRKHWATP